MFREIIDTLVKLLAQPGLLLLSIMVIFGMIDLILEYIRKKKYTQALIEMVIATVLSWPMAIIIAIYVGYKLSKEKESQPEKEQQKQQWEPNPGSSTNYERWKSQREDSD